MKILIQYFPDNSDEMLYKADAENWEIAEQQLETLRKVVAKDAEAEAKKDNDF